MHMRRIQRLYGVAIFLVLLLPMGYSFHLNQRVRVLEIELGKREVQEPLHASACDEPTCPVSMVQLLAHPARYHGQRIRVTGTYCLGFEMSALFPSGAAGILLREESIWIDNPGKQFMTEKDYPVEQDGCKPVMMFGVFEAGKSGHLGQHFGRLVDVTTDLAEG